MTGAAPSHNRPGINPQTLGPTTPNPTAPRRPMSQRRGGSRPVVAAGSPGPDGRYRGTQGPPVAAPVRGGFPGTSGPGTHGSPLAGPGASLPAAGGPRRDPGRAVCAGFVGEQFALPDAVTMLRETHRSPASVGTNGMDVVSACDPLNLVGIVTPGERVPALPATGWCSATALPWRRWKRVCWSTGPTPTPRPFPPLLPCCTGRADSSRPNPGFFRRLPWPASAGMACSGGTGPGRAVRRRPVQP